MQSHSLAVGHMNRCDEDAFHKKMQSHLLFIIGKDVMKLPFTQVCNVTHFLLVIGKDGGDCLSQNVQCQGSLSVIHTKRCDETPFNQNVLL